MLTLSLFIIAFIFLLIACSFVVWKERMSKRGNIHRDGDTDKEVAYIDGHEIVKRYIYALMRIVRKEIEAKKKLALQYILHIWVRMLSHIDKITTKLYARSRDFFVKSAVKNKSSIPHFWEHLKTYKQEIDKEKTGDSGS